MDSVRYSNVGELAECGEEIVEAGEGGLAGLRRHTGPGEDEGDGDGVLVHVLFTEQTVTAEGEALITGEDDEGVIKTTLCL